MQPYAGWWSADPSRAAAVSPDTNQRISYIGRAADDSDLGLVSIQHRFWMRFEYEDAECKYPLLIEWQNERRGGTQRWRVDHIRSAALWRREAASAASNPAYGLWRRADDAITQALARWPATDAIGPAPSGICINGGWHNGAWTGQYYRSLSTRQIAKSKKYLGPPLVSLAEPAPSPWKFVSQSSAPPNVVSGWLGRFGRRKSTAESLELMLARSDFAGLPEPSFCGTHLRSHDGTRAIIPVGFLSRPDDEKHRTVRLRLLYIDDDLICDCLSVECVRPRDSAHGSVVWRILFNDNASHLRNGGVLHRRDGLTAQLVPEASGHDGLGPAVPRPALWYRLTYALVDALPSWQPTTLNLPQEYLTETSPIEVPLCERVVLLGASGFPGAFLEGFAVTSLKDRVEIPAVVSTFESAFKEMPHQTTPAQVIRTDVGWWSIEPEAQCIGNVASGQRIALDAGSRIANWGEESWHFSYRDREVEYPVVVRRKFEKAPTGGTAAVLEIDHGESARIWRGRANQIEGNPPYGLWRRVDDAVVDALCCWNELGGLTKSIQVHAIGGWFNGAWHATWRCSFSGARYDPTGPASPLGQPILEPLDSAAPPPWQFVNHAKNVIRADLAHVRREPGYMPTLPPRVPLEGFQGQTPYLIRADEKAVLFPAFAGRRWVNSSYPDFTDYYVGVGHFTYANEDMFLTCPFDAERSTFGTNWRVELGARTEKGTELSRSEEKAKWPLAGPANYAAWRRLTFDLLQSWPNWRGSGCRLLEDPAAFEAFKHSGDPNSGRLPKWEKSGIALEMPKKVVVTGGFVGGLYTPYFTVSSDKPAS
jgi:hypothetical protein